MNVVIYQKRNNRKTVFMSQQNIMNKVYINMEFRKNYGI